MRKKRAVSNEGQKTDARTEQKEKEWERASDVLHFYIVWKTRPSVKKNPVMSIDWRRPYVVGACFATDRQCWRKRKRTCTIGRKKHVSVH